jgi:hypothetical protein
VLRAPGQSLFRAMATETSGNGTVIRQERV